MENKFFSKRLVFLKSDAEKTFGELEDLKKPGTVDSEFSVNTKIAEADAVWGMSEAEFLKIYDSKHLVPTLAAGRITEVDLVEGKLRLIDALDDEIKTLAGEDLNEKVKDLNGPGPGVHDILKNAMQFYRGDTKGAFGTYAEKQLYISNLEKFGLNLKDDEMKTKERLAKELPSKIREQEQKEADYQLARLELDQLKQESKEIDENYAEYSRYFWKIAKVAGLGALAGAGVVSGIGLVGLPLQALGWLGAAAVSGFSFVPQIDLGFSKAANRIEQFWKESIWGIPGAEKAKKHADFKVQNIQNKLGTLQAKEKLKKARIEADLKRLQDRRAAVLFEMKPVNEKLKIKKAAGQPVTEELASLAASQEKLTKLDEGINFQEKLIKVFHLTDKHRDKISNKGGILDTIAASEHLPGTGKRIKEIYEAPDKRTADAQKEISKIKMGDISYIIEAELDIVAITDVESFVALGFMSEDDLKLELPVIKFLKDKKETRALYDLLVNTARLSGTNPFQKETLRVMKEATKERKSIRKIRDHISALPVPPATVLPQIKALFDALSTNKKTVVKTAFAALSALALGTTEQKEIHSFLEKIIALEPQSPLRKAAIKIIAGVLP